MSQSRQASWQNAVKKHSAGKIDHLHDTAAGVRQGLFRNDSGIVTSCVSKMEFLTKRSEQFVEDTFEGSLPRFLTAFTAGKRLSEREVAALKKIIEANSR